MNAGRELDALVAEKVMGWENAGINSHHGTDVWKCGNHLVGGFSTWHEYSFSPSASISDAWKVVDKMHQLGFFWWMASHEGGGMSAHVRRTIDSHTIGNGYHASCMAHSICLAALGALEIPGFTHPSEEHNRRAKL